MKRSLLFLILALPLCAAEKQHDIVVYGGTSGGIIAAIQAAKSERSVVLVSPTACRPSVMAFGSIRMEPVLMILSQSAATAAAIAIGDGITVQQVPYEKLKQQLGRDEQKL